MSGWIALDALLPSERQAVEVYCEGAGCVGLAWRSGSEWIIPEPQAIGAESLTHWRALPPPPGGCPACGGSGAMDSGGTQPWGEPIFVDCTECGGPEQYLSHTLARANELLHKVMCELAEVQPLDEKLYNAVVAHLSTTGRQACTRGASAW